MLDVTVFFVCPQGSENAVQGLHVLFFFLSCPQFFRKTFFFLLRLPLGFVVATLETLSENGCSADGASLKTQANMGNNPNLLLKPWKGHRWLL